MRINHNIAALNTYRQLSANSANGSKALEKLSSGLRINKAGDDAAGLAISEKMRAQIRGLDQATRNAQDGISMIQTAEGALNETHSILQRMRELANQSANDTNVNIDRDEIQKEINQLTSEINRIGNTTEFNTQKLLNGGSGSAIAMATTPTTEGGAAGNVSTVTTITQSVTGKSKASWTLAAAQLSTGRDATLTIESNDVGTDLNGYTIKFVSADQNPADPAVTVTNDGAKNITITGDFDNATTAGVSTLANIQTALNNSGVFSSPVTISLTRNDNGAAEAMGSNLIFANGASSLTKTFSGGQETAQRGVYSFDVSQAFVSDGNNFTLKVPTAANADSWETITLAAELSSDGVTANTGEFSIGTATDKTTAEEQASSIATALKTAGGSAYIGDRYDVSVNGTSVVLTEKATTIQGMAVERGTVTSTATAGVYTYTHTSSKIIEDGGKFTIDGVDINVVDNSTGEYTADINAGRAIAYSSTDTEITQMDKLEAAVNANSTLGAKYTADNDGGGGAETATLTLTQRAGQESGTAPSISGFTRQGSSFEASFQIGANTSQSMTIEINDMRAQALKVSGDTASEMVTAKNGKQAYYKATKEVTDGTTNTSAEYALDVSSHDKATAAISVIQDAIESVSAERSKLGAYQNRLEHTINNLGTSSENMTAAESRIRDVDMAKEMMEFTKNNILSQAAQAMLAQANGQPQGVLQLLR